MSSSSELPVWRRYLPRRNRRGMAVTVILAASGLVALRMALADAPSQATVKREDLVQTVEVEGELAAVRSTELGVPPVSEVEFKIAFLAPEGAMVKKGQPVMGFDTEALERALAEKRAELQEAAKKLEQKHNDLALKLLEIDEKAAQAAADVGKARLKAEVPPEVQQRIELEKARLDVKALERELENLQAESQVTRSLGESELASLANQRDLAQARVRFLESALEKMSVQAPQDGVVVYRTNWRDEKKKVGDTVWFGEDILALPDLSQMRAEGSVDEADGGALQEGQPATLRLEARPDLDLRGRVSAVARTVRQKSWRTPFKVFRVDVALERSDPTVMRPAMRFRGEIETGRVPGLLLVPREAVFLRSSGPVAWTRGALGWREAPLRLGRSNQRQAEVVAGLSEGERVSLVDLSLSDAATGSAPGARR